MTWQTRVGCLTTPPWLWQQTDPNPIRDFLNNYERSGARKSMYALKSSLEQSDTPVTTGIWRVNGVEDEGEFIKRCSSKNLELVCAFSSIGSQAFLSSGWFNLEPESVALSLDESQYFKRDSRLRSLWQSLSELCATEGTPHLLSFTHDLDNLVYVSV